MIHIPKTMLRNFGIILLKPLLMNKIAIPKNIKGKVKVNLKNFISKSARKIKKNAFRKYCFFIV